MRGEQHLTFERYRLDLANEQLWRDRREIPLPGKAFGLLRYLVEHAGQLVTKAELFATLWPGTVVTDNALTFSLAELRKALGDHAKTPRFIETVHRRGYRFIATVVSSQHPVGSRQTEESSGHGPEAGLPAFLSQASALWPHHSLFVGRETEVERLHGWLANVLRGERQVIFVTGEPGIGKTTLVDAFLQHVAHRDLWLGQGQCIEQYGAGEAYMPILEAFSRLCRTPEGKRLRAVLHQYAPTWLVQMSAVLNAEEREVLQRQTQGVTQERMLREMGEAVEAITSERPLVLWLEDLHWSDASTLELLALLARRRERARLLVLGTYRPVDVLVKGHPLRAIKQELQLHGQCHELPLGFLSEEQVAGYVAARFEVSSPTHAREERGEGLSAADVQDLAKLIHRRTDGSPLFMVVATEDLIEQRVLVQEEGLWVLHEAPATVETRVPGALRQLIEQHIERLSAEERRVLEAASVAGMEFSAAAVAAGIGTEIESVEKYCAELARKGQFLRAQGRAAWPDGSISAQYEFLHALYHQLWYERVTPTQLQRLHRHIGERKERAYGDQAHEIAAELALHFEQGRDHRRAVQYLHDAAERATQRSAALEAIAYVARGLELLKTWPETPERVRQELLLHLTLGVPLQHIRTISAPEVHAIYARARELCQQLGETRQLIPVLVGLRAFHHVRGELLTARELGEQLLDLAQREHDPALLGAAHLALGNTVFHLGEFAAALAHLEQSLTLYDAQRRHSYVFLHNGIEPGSFTLIYAALVLWHLGYPDQAIEKSKAARTLVQEVSHLFSVAGSRVFAAMLHQLRRESLLTQEWAEAALTLALEHGFAPWLGLGAVLQGCARAEQGQFEEGISQIRQGLAARQAAEAGVFQPYNLALLAEVYGKAGQTEEGMATLAEALALVDHTGERWYEAELYRLKGELTLQVSRLGVQSNGEEAEACFLKAIDIARHQQAKSLELRAVMSLSRLWQQQGKKKAAHQLLSDIYGWFTEGFDTKDLQEAEVLLDEFEVQ